MHVSGPQVELEGCRNFRDLGGNRTADGGVTREGVVYRSDSLHRLSTDDVVVLRALGVRSAIDLRSAPEREGAGIPDESWGMLVHHLPMLDRGMQSVAAPTVEDLAGDLTLADRYVTMLAACGSGFADAVRYIAAADNQPVVFYCMAGKDRTGLLAALVLGLAGVVRDDIVGDYAATQLSLEAVRARIATEMPDMVARWAGASADLFGAFPETMSGVIDQVDERWGGFDGYGRSIGLDPEVVSGLRDTLVEPEARR